MDVVGRADVKLRWILMQSQCPGAEYGVNVFQSSRVKIIRCDSVSFTDAGFYIGGIAAGAGVQVSNGSAQRNARAFSSRTRRRGLRVRGVRA